MCKQVVVPKNGATVTIFAPYDCGNKCPFCINKKDYKNNPDYKPNIYQVFDSIGIMDEITPNCDFVITGGEPFADYAKLVSIIGYIHNKNKKGSNHKIFINTTAPWIQEDVKKINDLKDYITGINISRHITKYVKEGDDRLMGYIEVPVRINCVLMTKIEAEQAKDFKSRFSITNYPNSPHYPITGIQFRDNYIDVGWKNLYNMRINEIYNTVLKNFIGYEPNCPEAYITKMESFRWTATIQEGKHETPIYFHRTMEKSRLENDRVIEINDVIIRPNGNIMDDWNEHGIGLDLDAYKKGVAANAENN